MKKELLQQVLDALENSSDLVFKDLSKSYLRELAVNTLREAIAQPEQPASPVVPADEALEDAAVLLGKYHKLCVQVGRGDSYHRDRILRAQSAALAASAKPAAPVVPATPTAQPEVQRGYQALLNVIQTLRETANYNDDEGEVTDALEELAEYIAASRPATPTVQPAESDEQPKAIDHRGEIIDFLCDEVYGQTYVRPVQPDSPAAQPAMTNATGEAEHYVAQMIDRGPEPLRRLADWLSKVLDEDYWKTAERMLLGAYEAATRLPAPAPVSPSEPETVATNFWLIERGPNQQQNPHMWWVQAPKNEHRTNYDWTPEAIKATRFPTKQAAVEAATLNYVSNFVITSHGLMESPEPAAPVAPIPALPAQPEVRFGTDEQRLSLLRKSVQPVTPPVAQAEPMFWVRLRSDGGYEGPLHNDSIEAVRKNSGAWTALFPHSIKDADSRDAGRYRFLKSEAYEAVIPFGGKIDGSRAAWITKFHPGADFDEAIDAAIQAKDATP